MGLSGPARRIAILGAGRRIDHLELLAGQHIVTLVSDDVDDGAAGALVGLSISSFISSSRPVQYVR